ncbi:MULTISPECIES: PAS domain-containing sensor histidine kinase [unclassified Microbacterium]|uniref:sensor histidine kinase n=1 Tax=unclassified Microbacterium TaxID=2609290 RepID=UPI00214B8223|nr:MULTISPECIES: PAS domain-containing sensor histidine kinase [unclassified Microbacterium]MCR2784782.1 PAS domain-containing sensor histidine kinase [Microbacterium sp. zg.B96]WIM16321.1 PAS domain-containing sensor histidine kinase [Microbacterium sp. zg-B96]
MPTGVIPAVDPAFDLRGTDGGIRTVWIWQLLFAAVVAIIIIVGYLLDPAVLGIPPLVIGVAGVFATTIAALVIPWRRLPEGAIVWLPYLDILWVGLLTFSTALRISHLWVFPITWLAAQFPLSRLVAGLAVVAVITLIEVLANESSPASALRVLIAVLALAFVGVAVHATARQARAYRTLLMRQSRRIHHSLDTVSIERRRISDMLDAVHIAIAQVSTTGELLSANSAYRTLYAIDESDPSQRAHSIEYDGLRGRALRTGERSYARAMRGEEFEDERVWLFDPDGRWHALSITTRHQQPRPGEEDSTVLIAEDITEVVAADKRRQALAAQVSHELRNPLTGILGHTDRLLESDRIDERERKRLLVIEESSERMMHLVSTILSSQPDATTRADRDARAVTDLRAVVEASVESFAVSANDHHVRLSLDAGEPLMIWGDAFRLRQLTDNLLGNALKYTPAGGTVHVSARHDGSTVELSVADTGMGIAATELPHIFEPYFRSETAVESGIAGTGLGLSIVRTIVEAHGGTIHVDSEPGVGTTITIRIPAEAP